MQSDMPKFFDAELSVVLRKDGTYRAVLHDCDEKPAIESDDEQIVKTFDYLWPDCNYGWNEKNVEMATQLQLAYEVLSRDKALGKILEHLFVKGFEEGIKHQIEKTGA